MAAVCTTRSVIVGLPRGTPFAVRLGPPDSPYRFRYVALRPQPFRQFPEPSRFSVRFDHFEIHPIHARRSLVGFAASVGVLKDVASIEIDIVVQQIKLIPKGFLRFRI